MTDAHLNPQVRHDAVLLFDVTDGNPNGDPDAANQPRTDDETGQGIVTDVAIKRKIRNVVPQLKPDDDRYGIFVEAGHALNTRIAQGLEANPGSIDDARQWLCDHYFDLRIFGGVLSTGEKKTDSKTRGAGQLYGPTQISFARSISQISPIEHSITRVTPTTEADVKAGKTTEMGRKWTVPYGLYQAQLHFSGSRAAQTGVTSDDMGVLWQAITMMFEHDRSAARGEMKLCGLYVFSHDTALGSAPAHRLLRRIQVTQTQADKPPRAFSDYRRSIDTDGLPNGVSMNVVEDIWT